MLSDQSGNGNHEKEGRMNKLMHGVAHGRMIELTEDLGVPEGQHLEVVVRSLPPQTSEWGAGLRRCAGALSDEWSEEDDRVLDEIYQERKRDSRPELLQ